MKDSNAVPIRRLATALALARAESQAQHDFVRTLDRMKSAK